MADNKSLIRNLRSMGIIAFLMISVTSFVGYFGSGFDTQGIINLFNNYGVFGLGSLVVILIVFLVNGAITKDDKYGNSVMINSPGETPALGIFKFFQNRELILIVISFIVFGIIGAFSAAQGQSFTGEVLIGQQFGTGAELFFKFLLIPLAENLQALAFGVLSLLVLRIVAVKNKWSKGTFQAVSIVTIILVTGLVGFGNHQLRYGASDLSGIIVFTFWSIGGLLTVITGSFWPFAIMHAANNLFYDLQREFSSDSVVISSFLIIAFLVVWLIYLLIRKRKKDAT